MGMTQREVRRKNVKGEGSKRPEPRLMFYLLNKEVGRKPGQDFSRGTHTEFF